MKASRKAKNAFLTSLISLVLCFSMLLGTTYAWFTDTASTAVNTIQAGKLDVELLTADESTSLEGRSLVWQKATGHETEQVLWEPGCTYKLTPFKIKNNGTLALKYQIAITGIVGDAGLMKALEFTVTGVGSVTDTDALNGFEGRLAAGETTDTIQIVGKMKTDAGNEYQGMKIENIGITVRATQLGGTYSDVSGEFDSIGNEYDKNATYPPLATYINNTTSKAVTLDNDGKTNGSAATVIEDANAKSTIPAGTLVYAADGTNPAATNDDGSLNRNIKTTAATADSVTYDISYNYVAANGTSTSVVKFGNVVENIIPVSTGLKGVKVTHTHGTTTANMTPVDNTTAKADGTYYYDSANGKIYVWSSEYSSFKIEYESNFKAAVGGQGYATLKEAINAAESVALVTVLKDFKEDGIEIPVGKTITLDLAGKTITGVTDVKDTAVITNHGTLTINGNQGGIAAKAIAVLNNGSLIVNGGTYSNHEQPSGDGSYIFDTQAGGTATIDGVTISALFKGIRAEGSDAVVVVKNSTADVTPGYGLFAAAAGGHLTVESGTYKTTYSAARQMFDLKNQGKITVSGGSFTTAHNGSGDGAEMVVFNQSGNIANSTFEVTGGTFNCVRGLIYYNNTSHDDTVRIQGGTFVYRNLINNPNGSDDISITGGTFSSDPTAYLAEGKMAVENNGVFEVINDTRVKTEAELQAAVQAGGEVTLGADITLTKTLEVKKDVTLNLGTYKITGKDIKSAVILTNDSGTIKAVVNATTGGIAASGSNGNCFEMPSYNGCTVELTINGGNYRSTNAYFVNINAGSTTPDGRRDKLFINGGTYSGDRIICVNPANTEITITNGSLTATGSYTHGISFGTNSKNAKLTMTGGEVKYENGSVITAQASGNTIDIRDHAVVTGKLSLKNCTMNITGGTVNITGNNQTDGRAIMVSSGTTLNISDNAKVTGTPLFNMNGGTVNITGGMFKGKIANGLNYGATSFQSVKDLLTGAFQLSGPDGDGWYQVVAQ